MFVPFVNAEYENTWHENFKWSTSNSAASGNGGELSQDIKGYYDEKRHLVGGREENVIQDVKEWWVNGNIVCNEHCPPGQTHSQYWGDQLLVPLRDMFHRLCEQRQVFPFILVSMSLFRVCGNNCQWSFTPCIYMPVLLFGTLANDLSHPSDPLPMIRLLIASSSSTRETILI